MSTLCRCHQRSVIMRHGSPFEPAREWRSTAVLVMLHSHWMDRNTIAPTVGFNQGIFGLSADPGTGKLVVRDASGDSLTLTPGGQLVRGSVAPGSPGGGVLELSTFTAWIRAHI